MIIYAYIYIYVCVCVYIYIYAFPPLAAPTRTAFCLCSPCPLSKGFKRHYIPYTHSQVLGRGAGQDKAGVRRWEPKLRGKLVMHNSPEGSIMHSHRLQFRLARPFASATRAL